MMAQPVKIIPPNYYNVIIAKIWPRSTALDLNESWERLYLVSGIHDPTCPEIPIFAVGPVLVQFWSVNPYCASFKGPKQELSGPVWLDLGFKSFQQKILGSRLHQMVHIIWDCPYHMIDFIWSTSYGVINIDITIQCYWQYSTFNMYLQYHVNLSNANMIQL